MSRVSWRPHNNYVQSKDLEKDDDIISHMLLDVVATEQPLGVHHIQANPRLPKHELDEVLNIIQKNIIRPSHTSDYDRCVKATKKFMKIDPVAKFVKWKSDRQRDAFMTHSYRYFRLWLPSAEVEVAETNRYKAHTQKSELCVRARRDIAAGEWIIPLEGALARLDASQEGALTNSRKAGYGLRRDFSVVQVYGFPHGMLFLGPARFVNHDCNPNCELVRVDKVMRFKAKRLIKAGEEITTYYAKDYFGENNKECLCLTCEKNEHGGFAPSISHNIPALQERLEVTRTAPTRRNAGVFEERQENDAMSHCDLDHESRSVVDSDDDDFRGRKRLVRERNDRQPRSERASSKHLLITDFDDVKVEIEVPKSPLLVLESAQTQRSSRRSDAKSTSRPPIMQTTPSAPTVPTSTSTPPRRGRGRPRKYPRISDKADGAVGEDDPPPLASHSLNSRSTARTVVTLPQTPARTSAPTSKSATPNRASTGEDSVLGDDDAIIRVLRPRLPRLSASMGTVTAAASSADGESEVKSVQQRWKGWVELPDGQCSLCSFKSEELNGTGELVCGSCKRHEIIYGVKWPKRSGRGGDGTSSRSKRRAGVFADLSSSTSDLEDNSEADASLEAVRPGVLRFVGKHSRTYHDSLTHSRKGRTSLPEKVHARAQRAVHRSATRGTHSEPDPVGSPSSSTKTTLQRTVSIKSRRGAIPALESERPSKKRKAAVVGASHSTTTAARTIIPTPSQPLPLSKKKGSVVIENGANERSARALARGHLRDHPDVPEDERRVLAGAGLLRSGHPRARDSLLEKMPVTGPPLPSVSNKRKRMVASPTPSMSEAENDDDQEHDEDENAADAEAPLPSSEVAPAGPHARHTGGSRKKLRGAAAAAVARKRASLPIARPSSHSSPNPMSMPTNPVLSSQARGFPGLETPGGRSSGGTSLVATPTSLELRTRSGRRWGAPLENDVDSEANSDRQDADTNYEVRDCEDAHHVTTSRSSPPVTSILTALTKRIPSTRKTARHTSPGAHYITDSDPESKPDKEGRSESNERLVSSAVRGSGSKHTPCEYGLTEADSRAAEMYIDPSSPLLTAVQIILQAATKEIPSAGECMDVDVDIDIAISQDKASEATLASSSSPPTQSSIPTPVSSSSVPSSPVSSSNTPQSAEPGKVGRISLQLEETRSTASSVISSPAPPSSKAGGATNARTYKTSKRTHLNVVVKSRTSL